MKKIKITKDRVALFFILILSAFLNFWNIGIEGYSNQYYAAGVKSMTMSLKNFFFVSFDPAGFVTIDKPPIGFWLQAISAKIFGFSGWSILIPEAVAGVAGVFLIYVIVKRSFGSKAGLISALCLAVTPVYVAVSRNTTVDNILLVALLLACLAVSIAAETGKLKYLIFTFVFIGLGFNIKMLQAYMIIPAVYLTYLLSSKISIKKRLLHLILGTVILVVVSLSWAVVVDLIPASSRPYVGSSTNNSVVELVLSHNGLERLTSQTGTSNAAGGGGGTGGAPSSDPSGKGQQGMPPSGQMAGGTPPSGGIPSGGGGSIGGTSGGGGNSTFGGTEVASITRLFSNNSLSDQIIWLLPLALIGFAAATIKEKLKPPFDNKKKQALILWSMCLLPEFIYFSFTKGLFHPYYLTMLAPPIAALSGIGIVSLWELYKEGKWKAFLLPVALIADAAVELLILSYNSTSDIAKVLAIIVAVSSVIASFTLILLKFSENKEGYKKIKKAMLALGLVGLLVTPTVWSATTLFYAESGTFPSAGLSLISTKSDMGGTAQGTSSGTDSTAKLVEYLKANTTTEKYLIAVPSAAGTASSIIINYGGSVMALGGFSGSDSILTLSQFKQLVKDGVVRYAMVSGGGGGGSSDITSWITSNGKSISQSEWMGTATTTKTSTTSVATNNNSQTQNGSIQDGNGSSTSVIYDLKGVE